MSTTLVVIRKKSAHLNVLAYTATQTITTTRPPNKSTSPQSVVTIIWMTLPCSGRNHIHPTKLTWTSFPYQRCSPAVKCVCVYLFMCVFDFASSCARVRVRSHFCIVSVVWCVRGTQAHSGESIWDIYYALHQSFWTLDISLAEQIVSYQNSISEMTCRNSLLYPPLPPTEPLLHSCSLFLSPLSLPLHISPRIYLRAIAVGSPKQIRTQTRTCTCIYVLHTHEDKWSSFFTPSTSSHLSPLLK